MPIVISVSTIQPPCSVIPLFPHPLLFRCNYWLWRDSSWCSTQNGHTELADYLKSLPQQCKLTRIMSVVQYSYSLYTAAVTGDSDSRSEENGPPPTKKRNGDYLNPPSDPQQTPPETTGRRLYYSPTMIILVDLTCYTLYMHTCYDILNCYLYTLRYFQVISH